MKRLEHFIAETELRMDEPQENPYYRGALGGKNKVLKQELEFLRTHKIVE